MNFVSHFLIFVIIITNFDFSFGFTIGILSDNSKGMMKWSLQWAPSAPAHYSGVVVGYRRVVSDLFALQGGDDEGLQPRQLISLGMKKFGEMKINESIELFNKAEEKSGYGVLTPFLWQRGISLYYADRFQEGSDQFRYDVKVNPFDAEEIVWDIACQNRLKQNDPNFVVSKMALPSGKSDRRKIMRTVYSLFRGDGATEQDLAMAGHSGSPSDDFYALFYLGLYCESINENDKAANYMRAAANSEYARGKGVSDYMTVCAKVHCKLRNWL